MESVFHPLADLFQQLGLPASHQDIAKFIAKHAPLEPTVILAEADFWNSDQQEFLREELLKDADWAEAIDLLNSQLRENK